MVKYIKNYGHVIENSMIMRYPFIFFRYYTYFVNILSYFYVPSIESSKKYRDKLPDNPSLLALVQDVKIHY